MKYVFCILILIAKTTLSLAQQPDSVILNARIDFVALLDKVQKDNDLKGDFLYKGYKATIKVDNSYKSAIGRLMKIEWAGFEARWHTQLGYMTKGIFNIGLNQNLSFMINKRLYCVSGTCYGLFYDLKKPYIFKFAQLVSELKEIK